MSEQVQALILGIIQGLTEFLPVSSSGHLELAKVILGDTHTGEASLLMTVVLHFATAMSTVVVFRKEIAALTRGLVRFRWNKETRFVAYILLSMIPASFVGVFYKDAIESLFSGNLLLVGSALIVTGLLLFLADRAKHTDKSVGWLSALVIGIAQAIAITPGISRSGATISTSVLLGIDRERAARFSFLMVVPLIFGAIAKDIKDGAFTDTQVSVPALVIGFASAFLVGIWACKWMIALVKQSKLSYFAVYCLLVGAIALVYQFTHTNVQLAH